MVPHRPCIGVQAAWLCSASPAQRPLAILLDGEPAHGHCAPGSWVLNSLAHTRVTCRERVDGAALLQVKGFIRA